MFEGNCLIIDNFVPLSFQDYIKDTMQNMYGWKYVPSATGKELTYDLNDSSIVDSSGFSHLIFDVNKGPVSDIFTEVRNIFLFLEQHSGYAVEDVFRIKGNLSLPISSKVTYNPPHTDVEDDGFYSLIYYVDDADGDTVIFDKFYGEDILNHKIVETITPKKGRGVLLRSNQYHASANPISCDTRYVLNFVFRMSKLKETCHNEL